MTPDQRVIASCTIGVRSAVTYLTLDLLGYDVELFTGSCAEWSAHPELPTATGPEPGGVAGGRRRGTWAGAGRPAG